MSGAATARTTRLIDIVFPGATNHHGTLFGGAGLAHMDRVAFIAAARHARADVVTASCERIDFVAPAQLGDIIELTGRVVRVGRRSLGVEVELVAEVLSGERRRCTSGVFNMVSVGTPADMPPPPDHTPEEPGVLRMADLVMPEQTSHYGSLYGGSALSTMAKAAFVEATRCAHRAVVMAASRHVAFTRQLRSGEVAEIEARLVEVGRSSMTIATHLWSEDLATGERHECGAGEFVMVAVGADHRPVTIGPPADRRGARPR